MTKNSTVINVRKATKAGAVCNINGTQKTIGWLDLRAAAKQDDKDLAAVYATILDDALRMARLEKTVLIKINNRTNTPHGHEAEIYDIAGEFVSGRIVGVDFGEQCSYVLAVKDAERAKAKLEQNGYTVISIEK